MDIRTIKITKNGMPLDMHDSYQHGIVMDKHTGTKPGYLITKYAQTITIFYWD